jgi:ABC-type dipeptide/oligopeptide/nickel transport system permease subunit
MMRGVLAGAAVAWLGTVALAAILAPALAAHDPIQPIAAPLSPPAPGLLLGTDALGRDLLARMLFGARFSLVSGILATMLAAFAGGAAGLAAAMRGGWVERAILWASNALLSIPGLLLALMFLTALGPGVATIALAVGLGGAPGFARLSRAAFLTARRSDYVRASLALGASSRRVAFRHVVPNARTELLSLVTTQFAWAFLGTTTLTFLGLAGDLSLPEWGAMLNDGRSHLLDAPHLALWPGTAIALTILSVQYLGSWFSRRPEPAGPPRQAAPNGS